MGRPTGLLDHQNRAEVLAELHARPVDPVSSPARIRRVALAFDRAPHNAERVMQDFAAWCEKNRIVPPASGTRYHRFDLNGCLVTFELHTEFVTLTWVSGPENEDFWPEQLGLDALGGGKLVAATMIEILSATSISQPRLDRYHRASLCFSTIDKGDAQVATDFVADENGFTHFIVAAAENVDRQRLGTIVRRLLEIETYRTFTLLGLPLARQVSPMLATLERQLGQLVEEMGPTTSQEESKHQLSQLHALTLQLNKTIERTSYRFSASQAYADILDRRLTRLGEQTTVSFSTLERYLGNRIEPALATCLAIEKRQKDLGQKLEWVTEFLNTRIGLEVQMQNMQVMDRISKTSQSQYRLQKTVEGLSVIAISYYALGIVGYLLNGMAEVVEFSKPAATAALVPLVVGLVWYGVRRITKVHSK